MEIFFLHLDSKLAIGFDTLTWYDVDNSWNCPNPTVQVENGLIPDIIQDNDVILRQNTTMLLDVPRKCFRILGSEMEWNELVRFLHASFSTRCISTAFDFSVSMAYAFVLTTLVPIVTWGVQNATTNFGIRNAGVAVFKALVKAELMRSCAWVGV